MSPATGSSAALFQVVGAVGSQAALMPPQTITATISGSAVDILDFDGLLHVIQSIGAVTAATCVGNIQTSADGSTGWTQVTNASFVNVTTANNIQVLTLDTAMCQRFIRWQSTTPGTSVVISVTCTGIKKVR